MKAMSQYVSLSLLFLFSYFSPFSFQPSPSSLFLLVLLFYLFVFFFIFSFSLPSSSPPFNHLILLRNLFFAMAHCRHRIIFILVIIIIIIIRLILAWFQSPTHFKGLVNIFEEFVMCGIRTGDLPISSRMLYHYTTETYIKYASIIQL